MVAINQGTITRSSSNTNIVDVDRTSDFIIGALAGYSSGKIYNCYSEFIINATRTGDYGIAIAGGLVGGLTYGGIVEDCYATGSLSITAKGSYYNETRWVSCGGIVGSVTDTETTHQIKGYVKNVFSSGEIKVFRKNSGSSWQIAYDSAYIGGIAGRVRPYNFEFVGYESVSKEHLYGGSLTFSGGKDGTSVPLYNLKSENFITTKLEWDESVWCLQDGQYPKLRFELE